MKTLHGIATLILGLALLGAGYNLWRQHEQIQALREQARSIAVEKERHAAEKTALEKKLRAAGDEVTSLQTKLAIASEESTKTPTGPAAAAAKDSSGNTTEP